MWASVFFFYTEPKINMKTECENCKIVGFSTITFKQLWPSSVNLNLIFKWLRFYTNYLYLSDHKDIVLCFYFTCTILYHYVLCFLNCSYCTLWIFCILIFYVSHPFRRGYYSNHGVYQKAANRLKTIKNSYWKC